MEQQRARMEARRARKKKEKKEKEDNKKYGSGGKKATTRDTSKDTAKTPLVYTSANLERIKRGENPVDAPKKTALSKAVKATETSTQKKLTKSAANTAKPASKKPAGSGVTGSFRKSNPPSPTVTAKTKAGSRARRKKEDPRETARKRNLREAQAAKARRERKEAFSKSDTPMSPPKNPKEGDMYKKPFGPVMIYKNGKFVRA